MAARLLSLLLLLAVLVLGAGAWLAEDIRSFAEEPLNLKPEGINYVVKPGTTIRKVARDLAAGQILRSGLYFELLARWRGQAQQIKAGEFRIEPGTTATGLLDQMVSGKTLQYALTLVEGWTFRQVREALAGHHMIVQTIAALSDAEIMEKLGQPGRHPEGLFFPETYHFPRNTDDVSFLRRAYDTMENVLHRAWQSRSEGLPFDKPYEALILASIVEKETARGSERKDIAGVFVRRLKKGMRLQTDPTVIYGLGPDFDGNLRKRDLQTDTPYNTYTRAGLPPTPIGMPSADSIDAVLHPADGEALYFVARGDGGHAFSKTLQEHNRAVRKYQLRGH